MKVLKLSTLLCLAFSSYAVANENNATLDGYISDYKKAGFNYDYEKNQAESSKLRDSWIAPLSLSYSYSKSKPYTTEQTNQNAAIRMDQPIFQSGGIIYGIKYAEASRRYNDFSIDVAKRKMIKETIATLMQIKQNELQEKAQELRIKNADINLEQKKEQYLSGQLDSGFLDDAIIQRNSVKQTLYDIQTTQEKLINSFHTLSDLDYKTAHIPHLEFLDAKSFMKYNIVLKQNRADIQKNDYYKNVTIAKYLPKVSFTAGYQWSKSEGQKFFVGGNLVDSSNELDYYDYGLKASMPININMFRDIESVRVDYLKSQVVEKDKKRELQALFAQVMKNIKNFDNKIVLSQENKKLYKKLLEDTTKLYKAGYKTQYDVDTLKNSLEIQKINTKVFEIDKQLALLTLYEMYVNNGE